MAHPGGSSPGDMLVTRPEKPAQARQGDSHTVSDAQGMKTLEDIWTPEQSTEHGTEDDWRPSIGDS
jgi:hypothetical protein